MAEWNLTEAFRHFGVTRKNQRWSWSGRSGDGKTVVLALWSDQFNWKATPISYEKAAEEPDAEIWGPLQGNRERIENLRWAMDNCGGRFRVVMLRAKDRDSRPREIADCFPREGWWMEVTHLDEQTGAFRAQLCGD